VGFFAYMCFADMYADVYLSVQGPTKIIFWPNFCIGEIWKDSSTQFDLIYKHKVQIQIKFKNVLTYVYDRRCEYWLFTCDIKKHFYYRHTKPWQFLFVNVATAWLKVHSGIKHQMSLFILFCGITSIFQNSL
jgi:hypothetical protein